MKRWTRYKVLQGMKSASATFGLTSAVVSYDEIHNIWQSSIKPPGGSIRHLSSAGFATEEACIGELKSALGCDPEWTGFGS